MSTVYARSTSQGLADNSFQWAGRNLQAGGVTGQRTMGNTILALGYSLTMAVALCMGTGSTASPQSLGQRDNRYAAKEYKESSGLESAVASTVVAPRTAAEALSYVREVLKPAVTELASIFQVSRQSIYNWQAGEHISEGNQALLFELASAADTLLAHPLAGKINAKRKLAGGKTLLECVASGASGVEAAGLLISLAQQEGAQRAAIESKLKNRKRVPVDYGAVGSPNMYERV